MSDAVGNLSFAWRKNIGIGDHCKIQIRGFKFSTILFLRSYYQSIGVIFPKDKVKSGKAYLRLAGFSVNES